METRGLEMLAELGHQLDRHVFPYVKDGGIVVLNDSVVPSTQGTENDHGRKKERGSAAESRPGTTRRQGSSGGPRSSGDAASVLGSGLQARYEVELDALGVQYPGAQLWHDADGVWILTPSRLLPRMRQQAVFVTGVSFPGQCVRSWAFWEDPIAFPEWIGPRHTNFPDGSICAFEPVDTTWCFGDSIVELLDIYTLWALRHLYLREFGRWPGYQSIHFAGERLLELKGDEHCGCSNGEKLYSDCCMSRDLARDRIAVLLNFLWATGRARKPPEAVDNFVRRRGHPPSLRELVTPFAMHPIQVPGPRPPYARRWT